MSKRGKGEGSIYRRKDGRWTGVINLGWQNGKRKRKHYYGDTQTAVREELTKARRDHQLGLPVGVKRQSIESFLNEWLDSTSESRKPSTARSYRSLVKEHIIPFLGRIELAKLTPLDVERMMNNILKKGRASRTAQYARAVLRAALGRALKLNLVPRNVAVLAEGPRVTRKVPEPFAADDIPALLEAFKSHRFGSLFLLGLAHGLRQGEILALRWSDIDLATGSLRVMNSLQRVDGTLVLMEPKSARSRRSVSICSHVADELLAHRGRQGQDRLLAGQRWENSLGLVFTTSIGRPLDGVTVTKAFQRMLREAGLPVKRFHDLRHTAASFWLLQGVQPRVVMEMLGHSEIRVTLDLYSHVAPALQHHAAERMDALLARTQ